MTTELFEKAARLQSAIDSRKYDLARIKAWECNFRHMADDRAYIPIELQEEVATYVTDTLKKKYTEELETLEKQFAEL